MNPNTPKPEVNLCNTKYIWDNVNGMSLDIKDESINLEEKYADFKKQYGALFDMVKSGANMDMLKTMTNAIDRMKSGEQTFEAGQQSVAEIFTKKVIDHNKNQKKD